MRNIRHNKLGFEGSVVTKRLIMEVWMSMGEHRVNSQLIIIVKYVFYKIEEYIHSEGKRLNSK